MATNAINDEAEAEAEDKPQINVRKVETKDNEYVVTVPESMCPFFGEMYRELDSKVVELKIRKYKIEASTLGELFQLIKKT